MGEILRHTFIKFRQLLSDNSCANLLWLINILPTVAGVRLNNKEINVQTVTFWVFHIFLLFYVYILGTVVYLFFYAEGFIDSVNSFFNISVFVLIFNSTWWIYTKRGDLNVILKIVKKNDDLIIESGTAPDIHRNLLRSIKIIVIMCYLFHLINDVMIFIPSRTLGLDDFSVASCVGLEPLTVSPNREICMGILAAQELTSIVAVGSYDVALLFLFSHTTAVFKILSEEMKDFSRIAKLADGSHESSEEIDKRLRNVMKRHALVLHTVAKLQSLYSIATGVGFGLDAISICLFFVLPLDVSLGFAPLIYHSLFIFFLYCLQGQNLTTASEKFEMEVVCCGWENLDVKLQKYVLLILKQAQKPVIVRAAGIIPIRIYTFASTMESIYKFVTIFRFKL